MPKVIFKLNGYIYEGTLSGSGLRDDTVGPKAVERIILATRGFVLNIGVDDTNRNRKVAAEAILNSGSQFVSGRIKVGETTNSAKVGCQGQAHRKAGIALSTTSD